MAKEPKQLEDLFHNALKDTYFAEKKILTTYQSWPRRRKTRISAAFEKHRDETEGHITRLEKIFAMIDKKAQGKTCPAINGLAEEGAEVIEEFTGSPAIGVGLIGAAQAVEHYEISRYGTLRAWAEELGLADAASLLQKTLDEEEATDEALSALAEGAINQGAERGAEAA